MKHFSFPVALLIISLGAPKVFAQSEKFSIRIVPEPNQTVRMNMTQEMNMDITMDAPAGAPPLPMPPMKMTSKTVIGMTQKVGAANAQGNFESEITYDEIRLEAMMNGQPLPTNNTDARFVGKRLTVTYDKQGSIVDVKMPSELGPAEETVRQLLKSVSLNVPTSPMSIGETTSIPLDMTIPIPMAGTGPMKLEGQVRYKLVSVDNAAEGRIGRLDQVIEGKLVNDLEIAGPTGKIKMSVDFTITGDGTTQMNLGKSVLKSSDIKANYEGKIRIAPDSSPVPMPPMILKGVMHTTMTGTN